MGSELSILKPMFNTYNNINKNHKEKVQIEIVKAKIECLKLKEQFKTHKCETIIKKFEENLT